MTGTTPIPTDPYTGQPWQPTEAAAEGAALLDRLPWPRWRELVDPDRLDMSDGTYFGKVECAACVGAQLDHHQLTADLGGEAQGEWTGFLAVVFPALHDPHPFGSAFDFSVHYGFRVPEGEDLHDEMNWYVGLTAAWRAILTGQATA